MSGPVGLFDSGIGGTTVLREVRARLPHAPLLYLADQARCPYGPRDESTLRRFARDDVEWLLARGASPIVIACNTASAAALYWLREQYPDVAFIGMVPALKPAALVTRSGVVGVLATPATLQGHLLRDVMTRWAGNVTVVEQIGAGLVELIEAGRLCEPETRALLQQHLTPILGAGADTLVLGCTHYPFLIPLLRELAPHLRIEDAAPAVAEQVARVWSRGGTPAAPAAPPTGDDESEARPPLSLSPSATVPPAVPLAPLHYATTGPLAPFRALLKRLNLPEGTVSRAEGHPALL